MLGLRVSSVKRQKYLNHFFTTRDICIFSKEEDMSFNKNIIERYVNCKMATSQPVHGVNIEKVLENKYFYYRYVYTYF